MSERKPTHTAYIKDRTDCFVFLWKDPANNQFDVISLTHPKGVAVFPKYTQLYRHMDTDDLLFLCDIRVLKPETDKEGMGSVKVEESSIAPI